MSSETPRTRYCSRCLTTFVEDLDRCPNLGCRSVRPALDWGELMEPGDLIDRTYMISKRLAIGGAGVTYLAREVDEDGKEFGDKVAIKLLYQQRDQGPYLRRLAMEAQIIQGLHHPHIVGYMGFVHRAGHSPYLVTRYEEGGSLFDHLHRVGLLSVPVSAAIARQICSALSVAHRQSVVHRDLKPENVLLERPTAAHEVPSVRVADFGIAKVFGGVGERLTRVGAFVGTPQFAAPEQFEGLSPEPATDVYAVGALLYFCLAGRPVADFQAELDPEGLREHLIRALPPRLPDTGDPPALRRRMEELLRVAMAVEPSDRFDVGRLEAELADLATERSHQGQGITTNAAAFDTTTMLVQTPAIDNGREQRPSAVGVPLDPGPAPHPPEALGAPPPAPTDAGGSATHAAILAGAGLLLGAAAILANNATRPATEAPDAPPAPPAEPPPGPAAPAPSAPASPAATLGGEPSARLAADARPTAPTPVSAPAALRNSSKAAINQGKPASRAPLLGCGVASLGASLLAGLIVIGVGAYWWMSPRQIGPESTDAADAADWQTIATILGNVGARAERTCGADPLQSIAVVVDPSGQTLEFELLSSSDETVRACMEEAVKRERFPRTGTDTVRVAVKLQK